MNYKRLIFHFLFAFGLFFLFSCSGTKEIAYFQHQTISADTIASVAKPGLYDAHIKPKDILSITVTASSAEAVANYNVTLPQIADISSVNTTIQSQPTLQTYLVDNDGNIDFPMLGKLKVGGLTRKELEALLQKQLESAFSEERPIVNIRVVNYSVNVLGEVARPGKYATANDRLTIFEGLAMAGDLTIYGRRDNVKVLREGSDGAKTILQLNLNDRNVINAPAYYLEQNDVVYVEPNKTKARSSKVGSVESLSISALSVLISIASIVVTVLK